MRFSSKFRRHLTNISPILNTKVCYFIKFKKRLDLNKPVTLNEKILWLRFNTYKDNEKIKQCADKYRVRQYLINKGFGDILPNLIGVYSDPKKIQRDILPKSFAIKLNSGSGRNIIVRDKGNLDVSNVMTKLNSWMEDDYWKEYAELQYKDVQTLIIIEEYLGSDSGSLPEDYKFYCMNGKCKYVMICEGRGTGNKLRFYYFNKNWDLMPFTKDYYDDPDIKISKPKMIKRAFEIAESLSKDFPFVRVDLYIINGKIYFGELTFTPAAGLDNGRLKTTDKILGKELNLSY